MNITLKHDDFVSETMGLRDWFKSGALSKEADDAASTSVDTDVAQAEAFAELQASKTDEALSLFEEDEVPSHEEAAVAAPYDAGDASLDDLLKDEGESFTHVDEVDIIDVASLEDPYLQASIEGDLPEPVVFQDDENPPSV